MEDGLGNERVDLLGTTADDLVAIGRLLESPRLAHIWFTLFVEGGIERENSDSNPFLWDGLTVKEIQESTDADIPESTLYEDIDELVDIGAIRVKSDIQPRGYEAKFFQADGDSIDRTVGGGLIGPGYIGLVGKSEVNDSVAQFLDKYRYEDLNNVLQMLRADMRGVLDRSVQEMVPEADDADIEAVLPVLEDVFSDVSRHPLVDSKYFPDEVRG
ncbi:hypothetical protein SAMN05216388_102522 [Halorientalis persicus]|uniref:Sugar-specific transcriptional regulator TrmB n=1 Tax=Halorientalis persicus TaxID=1367881 RepID=A0A1H8U3D9_9EURY|nr:hypothetical protein [Halorientalis persicus]SEO97168.1 hypothetical protein SAMN05216388_102522 [Halorientalis persicus]